MNKKEKEKKLKEIEKQYNEQNNDITRLYKIFGGVIAVLLLFYLVFAYFHGDLFNKKEKTPEYVQEVEIMAGTALNREDEEYYVLFYDFDGDNEKLCTGIYNVYSSKSNTTKMYLVNLGSGLNKSYAVTDKSLVKIDANDLKIMDASIIKVKNKEVVEKAIGKDELLNYEDTLLK